MHPYSLDSNERRYWYVALLGLSVGLAWAFNRVLTWTDIDVPWWIDAPSVLGFFALLYELFDRRLWRLPILRDLRLVRTPDLRGRWDGFVESGVAEYAGQRLAASIQINQTFSHICVIFDAEQSRSRSIAAWIVTDPEVSLSYEYISEPRSRAPSTMQSHRGTARYRLTLAGTDTTLEGDYYSGRGRQGFGSAYFNRTGRN